MEEELRVRFGHCGVVVFDEELGAVGCVFQAVGDEAVLPAELLDEGFWREVGDGGIEDFGVCYYHGVDAALMW